MRGTLAIALTSRLRSSPPAAAPATTAATTAAARSTWSPTRPPGALRAGTIEPAFEDTADGEGVGFKNSFGSSGDQSRAVEAGLPADVVHLPLEPDIQRLIDAGLIAEDYDAGGNGSPQNSVVVFVTRPGNPEGIDSWDDLVTGEVEVITPNPFTSGGARWNIMAAYGSQIAQGKSEDEALDFVAQVLENTPVQDASARDALQTFIGGKGDVLLSYENEAIQAQEAGEDVEYVVPDETILIETKAAVTEEADDPEAAQAFLDFLLSDEGQQLFAEGGYRPVNEEILAEHEDDVPDSAGPVHDRGVRRLGDGRDRVLRSGERIGRRDRAGPGGGHRVTDGAVATAKAPPRPSLRLGLGGPGLTRGLVVGYLSLMVLLPIAAVVSTSLEGGIGAFWDAVSAPQAVAALKLTVIASFIVVAINVVAGTIIAWVLVRDQFPGKGLVNSVIDLPFALPTIVAGLTLLALYGDNGVLGLSGVSFTRVGVVMALLFVTLPFVIRAVQPVLLELDTDMEEAAASLGRRSR